MRPKPKWAMEKAKWKDCNAKSKADKLSGTKRWTFIGHCMTDLRSRSDARSWRRNGSSTHLKFRS